MQKSSSTEYLYGLNPAFECLRAGRRKVHEAFINELTANSARLKTLRRLLDERDIRVNLTDKGRLHQLSASTEHQNVVMKVDRYPYVTHTECLAAERVLLLDNVEDPHNVGAILRSAEVFGFHHILLPTKGVPEVYPSVAKVSAGSVEFLNIARDCNSVTYVQKALDAGYCVAALDAKGSVQLEEFAKDTHNPLLVVIGGEDKGVGQFILNHATATLAIPQSGKINSLNASVAASITLYALRPA
ncbi:RNA methyltransferase [Puniceicoccales bacterium CK1056]|uniref:RNA methyltransferase n=1 Tax=Oceanipulchritudo coccoides TaxID=2706888 RepID=A0A6B2LYH5_9BACT|nr:RNA methyltransferase [Oceanipulchritudo coccoides]